MSNNRLSGNSTDAKEWAEAFLETFNIRLQRGQPSFTGGTVKWDVDDALDTMIGWFANAIETGRMFGAKGPTEDAQDALLIILILVKKLGGNVVITDSDLIQEKGTLHKVPNFEALGGFTLARTNPDSSGPKMEVWFTEEDDDDSDDGDDDFDDDDGRHGH